MAGSDQVTLRVKVMGSDSTEATLSVTTAATAQLAELAAQVRQAQGWPQEQHVRFFSGGHELYMDDNVSKCLGSVLHCIASHSPAPKFTPPKAAHGDKAGQQHSPVDWLEMVDPGTVLMWIFGVILALLWLLFVCYAHMFDRTSVIMLCLMTVAFLIPCVLSYVPALRMLQGPSSNFNSLAPRYSSSMYDSRPMSNAYPAAGGGWVAHSTGTSYGGTIPPRPAARVRPGGSSTGASS